VPDQLVDGGPMQRFEAMKADPDSPREIFTRLSEGETLKAIAAVWGCPKGAFVRWYMEDYGDLYDAALKVRAADLAVEALDISDEQALAVNAQGREFDPDVARDKLRIDTRKWVASKFDRARYGESVRVERNTAVVIDSGLVGFARELLNHIDTRPGIVRQHERQARIIDGVTLTIPPDENEEEGVI